MRTSFKRLCVPLLLCVSLLCALLPGLVGCADSGMVKDTYGFERPEKFTWLSECLLLPGMPPLEQLFGTGGQSGLLSDYALEQNGKLNTGGTNYLVTLCYGTPQVFDLHTYLRFVLVSADGILYDEECVEVGSTLQYGIPVESFKMSAKPDARLGIKSTGPNMQGAVVIPFTVKAGLEGTLYVHCSLDSPGQFEHYYVGGRAEAQIGSTAGGKEVSVDRVSIGYLGEQAYNGGNFAEEAIVGVPAFEDGVPCYMVLDLAFTARKNNGGGLSLGCFVCIPDATGTAVTLEEAPTGKVESTLENDMLRFDAVYGIPQNEGEQKSVRMILRLNASEAPSAGMEIFLCGSEGVSLSGTAHVANAFEWVNPSDEVEEEPEGGIPTWGKVVMAVATVIALLICWGILDAVITPVDFNDYFVMVLAMLVPGSTLVLMLAFTSFAWWVVVLVELSAILLATLLPVLTIKLFSKKLSDMLYGGILPLTEGTAILGVAALMLMILFSGWLWWVMALVMISTLCVMLLEAIAACRIIGKNVGEYWPVPVAGALSMLALVLMFMLTPWVWWVVLLAELGVVTLGTLLAALIGRTL